MKGNELSEFKYNKITFKEGVFISKLDGNYGLLSNNGKVIKETQYDFIDVYDNMVCAIYDFNKNYRYPFYNVNWSKQKMTLFNYEKEEVIVPH